MRNGEKEGRWLTANSNEGIKANYHEDKAKPKEEVLLLSHFIDSELDENRMVHSRMMSAPLELLKTLLSFKNCLFYSS